MNMNPVVVVRSQDVGTETPSIGGKKPGSS